jgi:hypothetical protein
MCPNRLALSLSFGYALWSALMDKGIPEKPGMLLPFNKLKVSLALMYNVSKSLLDNNRGATGP